MVGLEDLDAFQWQASMRLTAHQYHLHEYTVHDSLAVAKLCSHNRRMCTTACERRLHTPPSTTGHTQLGTAIHWTTAMTLS
eukprot:4157968-Amphidinium_carterae.1